MHENKTTRQQQNETNSIVVVSINCCLNIIFLNDCRSISLSLDRSFCVSFGSIFFTTLKENCLFSRRAAKKIMSDLLPKKNKQSQRIFFKYTNKSYFMFILLELTEGAIMTRSHKHWLSDLNKQLNEFNLTNKNKIKGKKFF